MARDNLGDLPDNERCEAVSKNSQERCKNPKLTGFRFCRTHTRLTKNNRAKHEVALAQKKLDARMHRLDLALPESDPRVRGDFGLTWQIRQTLAKIDYYEDLIVTLKAKDHIWGLTERTQKQGFEKDAMVEIDEKKYTARLNGWIAQQQWERTHLRALYKMWIDAGFEKLKYDQLERLVTMTNEVITSLLIGLGRDPTDPEVRNVVRNSLLLLEQTSGEKAVS